MEPPWLLESRSGTGRASPGAWELNAMQRNEMRHRMRRAGAAAPEPAREGLAADRQEVGWPGHSHRLHFDSRPFDNSEPGARAGPRGRPHVPLEAGPFPGSGPPLACRPSTVSQWPSAPMVVRLLVPALLGACGDGPGAPESRAAVARSAEVGVAIPVRVDSLRRGTLVLEVSATGQFSAARKVALAAPVAGRVVSLPYREGDGVPAGASVFRLDPGEASLAVRQAEAELDEARARFHEMTLFDDRIEDDAIRRERSGAARARSGLARAEVALERARHELARTTTVAPFPGLVADVRVHPGEFVGAGEEVLTLVDLHPIRVEVQVPESELRWLAVGGRARVRLPALPAEEFAGPISAINPVVDPGFRTGRVIVTVANPEGTIRPGMYARVVLAGRSFPDRVLAPREALVERDGRTLVFLFQPLLDAPGEGLAWWLYVTPGIGTAREVELVATDETPLPQPGSAVIVDGNYSLVHQARVRVAEPTR